MDVVVVGNASEDQASSGTTTHKHYGTPSASTVGMPPWLIAVLVIVAGVALAMGVWVLVVKEQPKAPRT